MTYILFATGLAGLLLGGNWLVSGAASLAARWGLSPFVIGATVVGFGTSTPELLVSLSAAFSGAPGIAIGNVVGSNTANILLILGITASIGVIKAPFQRLRTDLFWMLAAALVLWPLVANGILGRIEGIVLVLALLLYLWSTIRNGREEPGDIIVPGPLWRDAAFVLGGLAVLMAGAQALVISSTEIARTFGVSDAVIGLTIVAVGTSLPELATSVVAALRGNRDIALGNVIGSNIFNILTILGLTGLVAPIPVENRFVAFDIPVMLAVSFALVALIGLRGSVTRLAGIAMLAAYGVYVASMLATG